MIKIILFSNRNLSNHRQFSLSLTNRFVFKSLYNHFQYARKAKEAAQQRGIDLSKLTAEQQIKLKPVLRLRDAFRVVNVVMGLMAVIGEGVWHSRRKKQYEIGKEINDELKPVWLDLKYFKHKGAMIGNYLLPEQIVGLDSKTNQIMWNPQRHLHQ
jgi:hypothetical protein